MISLFLNVGGWLVGSRTGRQLLIVMLALASASVLMWRVFAAGKAAQKSADTQRTLDIVRQRVQSDAEISSLSAAARRERLRQWVRD